MFRLIIALGIATMLLPDDLVLAESDAQTGKNEVAQVSTLDTLSAASSLYEDVTGFCERNEEACLTGKALAENVVVYARNALAALGEKQPVKQAPETVTPSSIDEVVTSSVDDIPQR